MNACDQIMNCPFVLIIPGCPMITQFEQLESTRFITQLQNPSAIKEICFSVSPTINIPDCGIVIYYSFSYNSAWSILGTVTTAAPSGIFRTGWGTLGVENVPIVHIGISFESGDFVSNMMGVVPDPFERELPIMKVAQDMYNFISSFSSQIPGKLIIPADAMDRWMEKTRRKLELDPKYFFK